jgi:hypothetical protein
LINVKPNRNGDIKVKYLKMDQNETALDYNMEFMNSSKISGIDITMVPWKSIIYMKIKISCVKETTQQYV